MSKRQASERQTNGRQRARRQQAEQQQAEQQQAEQQQAEQQQAEQQQAEQQQAEQQQAGRVSGGTSRRQFLGQALTAGAGVAAGAAAGAGITAAFSGGPAAVATDTLPAVVPFHGGHQAGVTTPLQPRAAFLSLDVQVTSKADLTDLFRTITGRTRFLTAGGTPPDPGIATPPTDSGILGPVVPADRLTVTLGVGASLFDARFGLAARKPAGLVPMPVFPDDHLVPAATHGDLSLQVCADNVDTVAHAVRDILKATRGAVTVRWRMDGFASPPRPSGTPRNLLGFKDGTSNLDKSDAALMDKMVWIPRGDWSAGGTYQAVRIIRMLIEFWDRINLEEQEKLIGRRRDSGAPMDGDSELDTPNFSADPTGDATPLTAHMRLANPRTPATDASRILRRPYNYDRGMDSIGDLDMGLIFIAYQADLHKQFEAVQHRLAGEPLVDYIQPTGGGYFLVLPGVRDASDFLGSSLLA